MPHERRYVCARRKARPGDSRRNSRLVRPSGLGEPEGRDTLAAVGLGAAVIGRADPDAVIAVFTADHIIRPVERFREIIAEGFALAEQHAETLVTFGITPTRPATSYGYLELGEPLAGWVGPIQSYLVGRFKEKPDEATAKGYFAAGPARYLWNSGMFVWRAETLLECIRRYEPANCCGTRPRGGEPGAAQGRPRVLREVYPASRKVSVDFAVMEPASRDASFRVAAVPMPLEWLDVGSWPMFAETCLQR